MDKLGIWTDGCVNSFFFLLILLLVERLAVATRFTDSTYNKKIQENFDDAKHQIRR